MLAQRPAKTLSARQYAQWDLIESYVEMPFRGLPPEGLACRSVVYTPPVYNTPRQLGHDLRRLTHGLSLAVWQAHVPDPETTEYPSHLADATELILVDEADRLKMLGLEELRDLYDRRGRWGREAADKQQTRSSVHGISGLAASS